jgi:hypothetical protein
MRGIQLMTMLSSFRNHVWEETILINLKNVVYEFNLNSTKGYRFDIRNI